MKKVAMIGVGKLGQDCAEVMAEYYDVVGYDVAPRTPANFPMVDSIEDAVKDRDIIFIAAPTSHHPIYGGETPSSHLPNKDFDYSTVTRILTKVNSCATHNQLVVLISTVLPGTVRSKLRPCITNARFIYNPYLIAMGSVKWDMVNPEMIIIGTEDGDVTGDAQELIDFYKVFMKNNPRYEVGTWDEAESIKIFYNTFISTKLALVNMIQDVAETNGNIDVDVVTNALAKSNYRITGPAYMKAGMGDAGACHPRDNIALRYLAEKLDLGYDLFDSIMRAREVQAERLAKTCLKYSNKVCIIGKAYKPGVPYTNGSYSLLVGHYIEKHGGQVSYYDLNTDDYFTQLDSFDVYLIGYWDKWVEDIFAKHNVKHTGLVIDPWRRLTKEMYSGTIIHYGNKKKDKKKVQQEQSSLRLYTKTLWPAVENMEDIFYVNATPSLIHKNSTMLVEEINDAIANGYKKVIFYNPSEPMAEIDFIKLNEIVPRLNIEVKNVYFLTATLNSQETKEKLEKKLNLNINYNVVSLAAMQHHTLMIASRIELPDYEIKVKPKKFLCFNKVLRLHRLALIGKLLNKNLLDSGYCSTYNNPYMLNSHIQCGINQLKEFDIETKNAIINNMDKFPLIINEYKSERANPIDILQEDVLFFQNSYYSIVTETLFFQELGVDPLTSQNSYCSSITITEKTFKPIALKHPFIIVGIPFFLESLKSLGYKTFSPFIDESYDKETNDWKRLEMIAAEVERLNSFSEEQWIEWQKSILPIIEHNQQIFFKTRNFVMTKDVKI